ncbi:MAG TPA: ATPase, T2SS/T4P/T4SS family [Thermoanaerobaculia bacterium]|nr:ATPase, T2SS/T4P/T4SS family [Thermoanaerobaculia bacterium]
MKESAIVSILSRKGGTGRSFIAVNVALAMRRITSRPVLLIDLNLPYAGDCLMQLGLGSASAMTDYAAKIDFLSPAVLEGRLSEHPMGIKILPACIKVELSRLVTGEIIRKFLDVLQEDYPYIVVDHGPELNDQTLAVLDRNTLSLLLLNQDLLAINQTRKLADFLRAIHYPTERVHYAVNKFIPDSPITGEILQANVDKAFLGIIPNDVLNVTEALMSGQPVQRNKKLPISLAIEDLAQRILYFLDRLSRQREHGISNDYLDAATESPASAAATASVSARAVLDMKILVHQRLVREMAMQEFNVSNKVPSGKDLVEMQMKTEAVVSRILDEEAGEVLPTIDLKRKIAKEIVEEALGLGPLERFLSDPKVSEIMVNGPEQIYIERNGKIVLAEERFTSEDQLRRIIERIVIQVGRRIDEQSPLVDARLLDGSRVNAVIPPVALDGSKLTIRKFSKKKLVVDDLIKFDSMTRQMAQFLQASILARKNIIISGGTGSGKTTLLNILSSYVPDDERIVTIEDSAELQLPQEHVARLETRPPNIEGKGEITIRDLVRNSLRMRPDRIIIGECRGGEALDMLQAMNTGHDGSLTTAHANTPRDALARLETMCLMAGMDLPVRAIREQIASAVQIIIQQSRLQDGSRKVTYITEVTGMEGEVVIMQDLFRYEQRGVDHNGKVNGFFAPSGNIPTFLEELTSKGIGVNREIFLQQRI